MNHPFRQKKIDHLFEEDESSARGRLIVLMNIRRPLGCPAAKLAASSCIWLFAFCHFASYSHCMFWFLHAWCFYMWSLMFNRHLYAYCRGHKASSYHPRCSLLPQLRPTMGRPEKPWNFRPPSRGTQIHENCPQGPLENTKTAFKIIRYSIHLTSWVLQCSL